MEKIFKEPKGDFVVEFLEESLMETYTGINPISITFVPNAVMQPYEALEYANEFSDSIVKEAKTILKEQRKFYEGWEIRFSNQFTGAARANLNAESDLLTSGKVGMNIYCKKIA